MDREEVSTLTAQIIARDFGVPQLSSTAALTITITDVNDNNPAFIQEFYNAEVPYDDSTGIFMSIPSQNRL